MSNRKNKDSLFELITSWDEEFVIKQWEEKYILTTWDEEFVIKSW